MQHSLYKPQPRLFQVTGTLTGYPWGLTKTIEADSIEDAHEEAEALFEEVVVCREIAR